jgi:hypothetical protein
MDEGAEPPSAAADEATVASGVELVSLKDGHAFLVADHNGDIAAGAEGLYDRDTRVLSRWIFCVGERHPTRLSSTVSDDNAVFTFHGTNRALPPVNGRGTPRGAIHIERRRTLQGERLYERVRCTNFGLDQVMLPLVFEFGADFRDMFEVRGIRRPRHGELQAPEVHGRHVAFAYDGLDGVRRTSGVAFSEPPWRMDGERAEFMFTLSPGDRIDLFVEAGAGSSESPSRDRFRRAIAAAHCCAPRTPATAPGSNSRAPISACWSATCRPDPIPSPASPGSRPRSAATACSPPGRRCGWIRRWRAAF